MQTYMYIPFPSPPHKQIIIKKKNCSHWLWNQMHKKRSHKRHPNNYKDTILFIFYFYLNLTMYFQSLACHQPSQAATSSKWDRKWFKTLINQTTTQPQSLLIINKGKEGGLHYHHRESRDQTKRLIDFLLLISKARCALLLPPPSHVCLWGGVWMAQRKIQGERMSRGTVKDRRTGDARREERDERIYLG